MSGNTANATSDTMDEEAADNNEVVDIVTQRPQESILFHEVEDQRNNAMVMQHSRMILDLVASDNERSEELDSEISVEFHNNENSEAFQGQPDDNLLVEKTTTTLPSKKNQPEDDLLMEPRTKTLEQVDLLTETKTVLNSKEAMVDDKTLTKSRLPPVDHSAGGKDSSRMSSGPSSFQRAGSEVGAFNVSRRTHNDREEDSPALTDAVCTDHGAPTISHNAPQEEPTNNPGSAAAEVSFPPVVDDENNPPNEDDIEALAASPPGMAIARALSRADLRQEFENEFIVAVEAPVVDAKPLEEGNRFKKKWMVLMGIVALVVVIVIAVGVATRNKNAGNEEEGMDELAKNTVDGTTVTSRPTVAPITSVPTTPSPSGAPTLAPTLSSEQVDLLDYLKSIALTEKSLVALDDFNSPQYKAFLWLSSQNIYSPSDELHVKFAMVTFYYSTNGPTWLQREGWLTADDPCTWYTNSPAMFCGDSTGSIAFFDLPSQNLRGTLPDELGLLTTMTGLALVGNDLMGTLPEGLFIGATNLRTLRLNDNNLMGMLPTELGLTTSLQELNVAKNLALGGSIPTEIGHLTNMRVFKADRCAWNETIPSEIGRLVRMEDFDVQQAAFSGTVPSEIGNLSALRFFNMVGVKFMSGPIPETLYELTRLTNLEITEAMFQGTISTRIGQLTNLRKLEFGSNRFTGTIPTELGLITDAVTVSFCKNFDLTGPIPSEVGHLNQLEHFEFHVSNVTGPLPSELGRLTSVTSLYMAHNSFLDGTIPTEFGLLTGLLEWPLNDCAISGTLPTELVGLSNLKVLNAAQTKIAGAFPDLAMLPPTLETFGVGSGVIGTIPTEIGTTMTALTALYLHDNKLTGRLPSEIGFLTSLETLAVSGNGLTGTLPDELANLLRLQNLYLHRNKLSGTVPVALGELGVLDAAYFDGNNFTGTIPVGICSASILFADCSTPGIECMCCNYCCADGEECKWNALLGDEPVEGEPSRVILPFADFPGLASPSK